MPAIDFLPVPASDRACHVRCERALLARLPDALAPLGAWDSIHVLHDAALCDLADRIAASLRGVSGASPVHLLAHPSGELHKSLAAVGDLADRLIEQAATRRSLLIVVGGGCLTDLGGFCAAVFLRGIDVVLVPTTVLAMADAAIGGKNGVDRGAAKNMLGTIRQPRAVFVDPTVLDTLPDAALRDGLVEIVKVAAIRDAVAFARLEAELDAVLARDATALDAAIWTGIRLKLAVVMDDEREAGTRALLNFGHTIGHALESLAGFAIPHGRAVALGMPIEMRMLGADESAIRRVADLLERLDVPRRLPPGLDDSTELWRAMQTDKKRAAGKVRIAAASAIGVGHLAEVELADLRRGLA